MNPPKITWDGSNIGDIDPYIISVYKEGLIYISFRAIVSGKEVVLKGQLYKMIDTTPLVIDELKPIFRCPKVGRHRILFKGKDAILCRHGDGYDGEEYSLPSTKTAREEFLYPESKRVTPVLPEELIRRVFAFRWIVGLTNNLNAAVRIRQTSLMGNEYLSYKDTTVNPISVYSSRLPETIVNEWFHKDWSLVDFTVNQLIDGRNLIKLRMEIEKVISRVDSEHIWWAGAIISRIQQRC